MTCEVCGRLDETVESPEMPDHLQVCPSCLIDRRSTEAPAAGSPEHVSD